jgi:hypothetical protein
MVDTRGYGAEMCSTHYILVKIAATAKETQVDCGGNFTPEA